MTQGFKRFIILGLGIYSSYILYTRFDVYKNTRYSFITQDVKAYEETKTVTDMGATESARLSIPEYIVRTNRKTGLPETVPVPNEIANKICSYDWPCEQSLKVASCESDFYTGAIGPTNDKGIFQIAPVHEYSDAQLFDRDTNIALAYKLWKTKGWKPWVSSKGCWK